ncbi:protein FAR1-RELATED SEQUENCE 5-like [Rosa rugosa]|uniref:protein FAR1-RELATED SEQUENCE 5-like n=1 Tax=Rosa rugosa TaxID=74645 RepID=UPI002B4105B8|nr:protein FAR1-RELATED SEQUENCE 5-like [Rosa rugosa]
MGNQPPKIIYTDQCQAMANDIRDVFPDTCHRLCLWYISLNATRHIASYLRIPDFKKMFNKCLYGYETVAEFQSTLDELLVTFNVTENEWFKRLYTLRKKWCATFSLHTFSARIQVSQRSESTNNVFHHISAAKMRLIEFVHHYDKQVELTRLSELEETFHCTNDVPSTAKRSTKLLYHAGKVYTRKIYNLFGTELTASMTFKMDEVDTNETVHTFELSQEGCNRISVVKLNSSDDTITCSCKMFESMGLLCRHALRVLNVRNFTKIPPQYILKRWKKDAKSRIGAQEHETLLQQKNKP